jgi:hypothetical protein
MVVKSFFFARKGMCSFWSAVQVGKAYFELVDYLEADHYFELAHRLSPCTLDGMDIYSTVLYVSEITAIGLLATLLPHLSISLHVFVVFTASECGNETKLPCSRAYFY